MSKKYRGVLFGADYYPEQWDRALWRSDAERMRDMGLGAIRVMEFAWTLLEPEPGRYDFSLFDEVIELFAEQGLKTVLGTPTATPPAWLYHKDPSMSQVYPDGTVRDYGTRRECCLNSKTYFDASMEITARCGEHFGRNPHVLGMADRQ